MSFDCHVYEIVKYIKFVDYIGFDLQLLEIMSNVMEKTYEIETITEIITDSIDEIFQKY